MEALLPKEVTFFSIWLLGLSLGLTACTATCLPFMGTWVLGRGGSQGQAWRDASLFISGRLLAYAMLGAIAGGAGAWLAQAMRGGVGNLVIGMASLLAGGWLLYSGSKHASCGVARWGNRAPPLMLGFSLSLTPCAPLAALLAVCAAAGSIEFGMLNGVAFGLGAALTPLLILLPLIGIFAKNLGDNRAWLVRWMRWGAAAVLLLLGMRRILLAI